MRLAVLLLVALLCVGGCRSGQPPLTVTSESWERASRDLAREALLLRRTHVQGQRYAACFAGGGPMMVHTPSEDGEGAQTTPVDFEWARGWVDEVRSSQTGGPFEVQRQSFRMGLGGNRGEDPGAELSFASAKPTAFRVSARNERLDAQAPTPRMEHAGPAESFQFAFSPDPLAPLGVVWPNEPLRPGAQWAESFTEIRTSEGAAPTHYAHSVTWRFLGVEHGDDASYAHLACDGRWEARLDTVGPSGARGSGRADGRIACAMRVAITDGHASKVRIDYDGHARLDVTGEEAPRFEASVEGRATGAIDRIDGGDPPRCAQP